MCGGLLEVKEGQTVVTCEFCGTAQTVPHFDNEKKATFFRRANDLRLKCEFDKASGVYETIVTEFPNEAEAYWGLVLCKYGIEYVDDPKTKKKIPTCHRTQFSSIFEDHDYLAAIRNADAVAREVYKREANAISKLQSAILEISSKEDPFDVFICYKETDERGGRTADSVLAQDIYDELTSAGYKVFFARRTLERRLGSEYEPYIFAALHSAKVMLHVTTNKANSDSVWVKNEWARYLSLIAEGQKKVLIPCYKGMNAYDLPEEMKNLQAQDMDKLGSMQDLIYGIKKIIKPAGRVTTTEVEKEESFVSDTGYDALIRKGHTYLKNHKMEQAKRCFEKAIEATELCGDAYLGILLCEYQLESLEELLAQSDLSILENENFKLAHEFANKSCNATLDKVEKAIINNEKKDRYNQAKSSLEAGRFDAAIEEFKELGDFEDSPEQIKECIYQKGQMYFGYINNIKNLGYCNDAIACFEEVISFKDSKEMIEKTNSLRTKITEEYKTSCISRYSIALPKDVTLLTLGELVKSVKANKDRVFTPSFSEFDNARAEAEASVIKFFFEKCPALIQSFKTLDECSKLTGLCSSIEKDKNLKSVHELIKQREQEIKEQIRVLKKKKRKKRLIITAITSGALAVAVATFFGVKAIVDENNRKATYTSANAAMESGNYDDAIAYYESLGNYNESQKKIKVCNGLKELEASIESKSEADMIKGIKTIVSAGEKVDLAYETENNVNIRRLAGGNSGNKTETIDNVDFILYQPTWSGYTFLNWSSDSLSYKNERTYLGALSNWSLDSYSITYNLNGGTNAATNPSAYTVESDDIVLAAPSKKGYTFKGWFDNNDNSVEKISHGSFGNIVLNARWTANDYTITFNGNNGTVNPTSLSVTFDKEYTLPTPTRNYYGFAGWYDNSGNKWVDGVYTRDSDLLLTAHWTPDSFTITYNLNSGTNNPLNPSSYTIEDEITFSDPSRTGYHFDGWTDNNGSPITGIALGTTGPITINANWTINTYTVTFKNWNGTVLDTQYVNHGGTAVYGGDTPTKPATAQYTYTHNGWDKPLTNITGNTIITATFSSIVNNYTITWKNWDGSTLKTESLPYGSMPSYNGATPTRPDDDDYVYSFDSWSPSVVSVTCDTAYTAVFTHEPRYYYSVNAGKATITGVYNRTFDEYIIPSELGGYPVDAIDEQAFLNCDLAENIVVPSSVTIINNGAFSGCSSLKSITIPFIGQGRSSVSDLYNRQASGDGIFGYIFGSTSYTNSAAVTTSSFTYYIPSELTTVIVNNQGEDTILPAYSFENNQIITDVTVSGNIVGLAFESFEFCKSLVSVDCSDAKIETIWEQVFDDCISLETVQIGNRLTTLGAMAFAECSKLQSIELPETLTRIYASAFRSCTSLTEVVIPNSVTYMGESILGGCTKLQKLTVPFIGETLSDTTSATPNRCLGYIVGGGSGYVYSCTQYYDNPNNGGTYSKTFYIPSSLKEVTVNGGVLGTGVFMNTRLTKVTINSSSTDISYMCFKGCTSLISVHAISYNNRFSTDSFDNCSNLSYMVLSGLTYAGIYAFDGCDSLSKIYFTLTEPIDITKVTNYKNIPSAVTYHYYSSTSKTNYWHYVDGVPTLW